MELPRASRDSCRIHHTPSGAVAAISRSLRVHGGLAVALASWSLDAGATPPAAGVSRGHAEGTPAQGAPKEPAPHEAPDAKVSYGVPLAMAYVIMPVLAGAALVG